MHRDAERIRVRKRAQDVFSNILVIVSTIMALVYFGQGLIQCYFFRR
jgi:hypothetical protein